jgi:hypothetical protein
MLPPPRGRYLQIMDPDGMESYARGQEIIIRWNAVGAGFKRGDTVQIDFTADDGRSWQPVPGAAAVSYDAHSFTWSQPALPEGNTYRIRLRAVGHACKAAISRKNFAIRKD